MLPSWQKDFAEVINLRTLRWENYPGLSVGPDIITVSFFGQGSDG